VCVACRHGSDRRDPPHGPPSRRRRELRSPVGGLARPSHPIGRLGRQSDATRCLSGRACTHPSRLTRRGYVIYSFRYFRIMLLVVVEDDREDPSRRGFRVPLDRDGADRTGASRDVTSGTAATPRGRRSAERAGVVETGSGPDRTGPDRTASDGRDTIIYRSRDCTVE
jgi:hypothetical protein